MYFRTPASTGNRNYRRLDNHFVSHYDRETGHFDESPAKPKTPSRKNGFFKSLLRKSSR